MLFDMLESYLEAVRDPGVDTQLDQNCNMAARCMNNARPTICW